MKEKEVNNLIISDLVFTSLRKRNQMLTVSALHNLRNNFEKMLCQVDKNVQNYKRNLEYLIGLIGSRLPKNILDIGCGFGLDIIELASMGHKCIGLEPRHSIAMLVNNIAENLNINLHATPGDACNLPFKDDSFDIAMSKNFFEHVYDFDAALNEQIRIVKHKGKIIIKDGNILCPPALFNVLFLYPIRTKGKRGGIKWIFTKSKVIGNYFEGNFPGRDEDGKTIWWWRRKLSKESRLKTLLITTTGAFKNRDRKYTRFLRPFYGAILIVVEKI